MNTAKNPLNGELEECTRSDPPHFFGDRLCVGPGFFVTIDTVDVDGDDDYVRVCRAGESQTHIVSVTWLQHAARYRELLLVREETLVRLREKNRKYLADKTRYAPKR